MKNINKNYKNDIFIVLIILISSFLLFSDLDLFEDLYSYSRDHEEMELDELFNVFVILPFLILWYAIRRHQDFKKTHKELEKLNQSLEEKIQEQINEIRGKELLLIQQSKENAIEELLRNISHQWRQPLNIISLSLCNIEEAIEFKEEIDKDILKNSLKEVDNLSEIINNFTDFFSKNSQKTLFNLKDVVHDISSIINNELIQYHISLESTKTDLTFKSFKNEIKQVLLSIITNSKDAIIERSLDNGTITLSAFEDEKSYKISIEDNAGGIDEKIINNIFEPYFTTKFKNRGTGISLYVSKMIVENTLQGEIKVANKDGGLETTITISKNQ